MKTHNTIAIIPARGNSKGVPRKNLRPLAGKPLLYYSITNALQSKSINRVVVSTEDEEIALFATRFGAEVIFRPPELSGDNVTIEPVIIHAVENIESEGDQYNIILTLQPTSPLLKARDIDRAMALFEDPEVDTVLSAVDDRHLRWKTVNGKYVPAYKQRLNRQQLSPLFKETGAIIACRREVLEKGSRFGKNIKLLFTDPQRSVDIDTATDFFICESLLQRKKIVFVVVGRHEVGLGHAYRSVMLAHELIKHDVTFLCKEGDDLATEYIMEHNYPVVTCRNGEMLNTLLELKPDLIINDILDTNAGYVAALKKAGILVVNFEDMGLGAEVADLVINALYPHQIPSEHILVGPDYFCLRDEFLHAPDVKPIGELERVLITFGGVDEGNLTCKVLQAAGKFLVDSGIGIDVVLGTGYRHHNDLNFLEKKLGSERINIVASTKNISEYMIRADLAITSGGRTVLELASLGIPTIVICQNERETYHKFASSENGVLNLGIRHNVTPDDILNTVKKLIKEKSLRTTMRHRARQFDLVQGKKLVIKKITELFEK
jgi:CMP-N-acetylneuraminic acid synthetase